MNIWMAPMGLHVALGAPQDSAALANIHAKGFYRGWPRNDFEAYLADPKITPTYVAIDKDRKVSGFMMLRLAEDEAELLTIAVDPTKRGKGLGRALLAAGISDLERTPVRRLFLEVDETNLAALRLYQGFGFIEIGKRKGYYPKPDGSTATALVMRADLG